jgi:3-phenylpropionate/cinnamic acid dioxygenase small subunit
MLLLTYTAEAVSSHHFPRLRPRSNIEDDDDDKDVSWAIDSTPDGLDRRDTRFRVESDHQDHPPTWTRRQVRQAVGKGLMKR